MTVPNHNQVAIALFALVAVLVGIDLLADAGSGTGWVHLSFEGAGTAVAVGGVGWFFRRYLIERREAIAWRDQAQTLLAGVGQTVEGQFEAWELSRAEVEVAMLLLKGLSFKEVAHVRQTGERTAREQARSVYRKAGVAGRAELSAWFIEDLLPPAP